jgi:hypothetical protein
MRLVVRRHGVLLALELELPVPDSVRHAPDGRAAGTAVISTVKLSGAEAAHAPATPKSKTVGGMSVTALRRTVIDRMVAEGGWVTNDAVREIQGRRVFVVFAQTGAPGAPTQSWSFYFTEVDGRVYSLATNTPIEFAEPVHPLIVAHLSFRDAKAELNETLGRDRFGRPMVGVKKPRRFIV